MWSDITSTPEWWKRCNMDIKGKTNLLAFRSVPITTHTHDIWLESDDHYERTRKYVGWRHSWLLTDTHQGPLDRSIPKPVYYAQRRLDGTKLSYRPSTHIFAVYTLLFFALWQWRGGGGWHLFDSFGIHWYRRERDECDLIKCLGKPEAIPISPCLTSKSQLSCATAVHLPHHQQLLLLVEADAVNGIFSVNLCVLNSNEVLTPTVNNFLDIR